jgi:ATP/maltotriose-dependent transcriptional regulator MalT
LVEDAKASGAPDDVSTQVFWRLAQATILAGRGESAAACDLADEGLALLGPRRSLDSIILFVSAADVHRAAGHDEEAKRLLEQAIELRKRKGIVIGADWIQEQLAAV